MLDDLPVVTAHSTLLRNGNKGDLCITATATCVRLVQKVCLDIIDGDPPASRIVVDIGVRMGNSAQAASLLALSGYWAPAVHMLRDLAEIGQLLEYFRYRPDDIEQWYGSLGKARHGRFSFGILHDKLRKLRGSDRDWKAWFDECSNLGSHPSREGLVFLEIGDRKYLGPTANAYSYKRLVWSIGFAMLRATDEFVLTLDTTMPPERSVRQRFLNLHAAFCGFKQFYSEVGVEELVAAWD